MIKQKYYFLLILLFNISCSLEEDMDFRYIESPISKEAFLTEYSEDGSLKQAFDYVNKRLVRQTTYRSNGVATIEYRYSKSGLVDSAFIRQSYFSRDLKFHYDDSLIVAWEVWNDNKLKQWVYLKRDEKDRIVLMNRESIAYGLREAYKFYWDEDNISNYEYTRNGAFGTFSYVYEYKYDIYRNPYYSVYKHIGFNFVDFTPLSKNNWTEMNAYEVEAEVENRIAFSNIFLYSGNYPFIRESKPEHVDNADPIHSVFEYIR